MHPDVIILGLGAMGSAAAHHLAARGVRVLGLDRFAIPHALGSSGGASRMIRLCYYEHPDYVPLLLRAYELWAELEQASSERLLYLTGGLYLGPAESTVVKGSLRAARQHGLPHEFLSRADVASRFPAFQIPADWSALYEPRAGFLLPERVIATHATLAMRAGAELHGHEPALSWAADGNGVTVTTQRGTFHAAQLLVCGGPWSSALLADLRVPLKVTRQVMGWVWPRDPATFALGRFPVWAIDHLDGTLHYGFPIGGTPDAPGLKVAHHGPAGATDPDRVDRNVTPADEGTFRPALARFLPQASGPLLSMRTCMYTNTPDGHFIIDRHPAHANVHLAAGFSGHGFKFASVVGEVLADLAIEGGTRHPIGFLGLGRFSERVC